MENNGVSRRGFMQSLGAAGLGTTLGDAVAAHDEDEQTAAATELYADMPRALSNNAGAVLDGELYSIGGVVDDTAFPDSPEYRLDAVTDVYAYDPQRDDWRHAEDLPEPLWGASATATDDALYVFGGAEDHAPYHEPHRGAEHMSDRIYRYVRDEGWEQIDETLPEGPLMACRTVYSPEEEVIYGVGGATGPATDTDSIWRFDPKTEQIVDEEWQTLMEPVRWPAAGIMKYEDREYLYTAGGFNAAERRATDRTVKYDLGTRILVTGTDLPVPTATMTGEAPVIDNTMYLGFGVQWPDGEAGTDTVYNVSVWAYDPAEDAVTEAAQLPVDRVRTAGAHGVIDDALYVAGGHVTPQKQETHDAKPFTDAIMPEDC